MLCTDVCALSCLQVWQQHLGAASISAAPASRLALLDTCSAVSLPLGCVQQFDGEQQKPATDFTCPTAAAAAVAPSSQNRARNVALHSYKLLPSGPEACRQLAVCSSDGLLSILQLRFPQAAAGNGHTSVMTGSLAAACVAPEDVADGAVTGEHTVGAESAHVRSLLHAKLPGQLFSSPVFADEWVLMGCRDDNLYCLRLNT